MGGRRRAGPQPALPLPPRCRRRSHALPPGRAQQPGAARPCCQHPRDPACPCRRCTPRAAVGAVSSPKKPFAAIVGGSKVSSKIGVIEALLAQCDKLVLG